jgi:hypothetical protein
MNKGPRTKGEVTKFIPPTNVITLVDGGNNASYHHCPHTDGVDSTEMRALDRHYLSYVLAINVQAYTLNTSGGQNLLRM